MRLVFETMKGILKTLMYFSVGACTAFFISCGSIAYSQSSSVEAEPNFVWRQINGIWSVEKGEKYNFITDSKITSYRWGYNELINHNTIITLEPLEAYDYISYGCRFADPREKDVRFMSSFGIKEDRVFYAFRLTGDAEGIKKIDFVRSTVKDPEKPKAVKWNFEITELASAECDIRYNTDYGVEIKIEKKRTSFLLNRKLILRAELPAGEVQSGQFGFSSLHMKPMLWNIAVKKGRKTIFKEDFATDTVRRVRVQGTIKKK